MLTKLGVKAQLGWNRLINKLREERGDAVVWIIIIIVCAIIVVIAFNKFGGSGVDVGDAVESLGGRAADGLDGVTVN